MRTFKPVRKGSSGTDVVVLQSILRVLGFIGADGKPLEVTGSFNKNLEHAINEFQTISRAYGIECGTNGKNDSSFGNKCWKIILGE